MLEINHYPPKQYQTLIERITIARSTDKEFDLMFIPTHYVTLFIPLNQSAFYYDGVCYTKPVLKNILLEPAYLHIPKHAYILGIRFFPFGAFPFSEFLTSVTQSHNITDDTDAIERVFTDLNKYYNTTKQKQTNVIKDFYDFLLKNPENASINNFCEQHAINYMSVYRSFQTVLGLSPKKFERLIKFRLSVDHMISAKQKLIDASFNSGYYDQAHFTKEFKYFVGKTPSEYIKYLSDKNLYQYDEFANFANMRM